MRRIQAIAAVATALALACGGDDGPSGNTRADYTLAVTPGALTIAAGLNDAANISIVRTNFTGEVALVLLNPPAGITGAFISTPASAVVISVAANVAPGSYPLTIQGTATGPGVKTATLTVTVPAPPTGGNVEYLFCDPDDLPAFFAYQDGTGAWQTVTGVTSGAGTRFTFNLTQGRGAVMSVFPFSASAVRNKLRARIDVASGRTNSPGLSAVAEGYQTYLLYGSTAELAQDGRDACAEETKTVNATVAGVAAGGYGIVSLGGTTQIFNGATSTNPITFSEVPTGPVDLVASRTTPGNPPDKIIVFRNLNIPDGGALPSVIDFNGPAAIAPLTATATITGGAGDNLEIFTDLVTANTQAGLWFDLSPSQTATRPWSGLGPDNMVSGDFHGLVVFATPPNGSGDFRVALKYVGFVTNQNLALGPILSAPSTSPVAAGAYPRFRFQGTLAAEYNKGASVDVVGPEGSGNIFSILATGAYLTAVGNGLAYDLTMPDVAGLAGFPAASRLTAGTNDVGVSGFGFNGPGIFDLRPILGGEFKLATRGTAIVVP